MVFLGSCGDRTLEIESMENSYSQLSELTVKAPAAKREREIITHHGREVDDYYFWLKDQSYPIIDDTEVLDYLEQENNYFKTFLDSNQNLVDTLFEEFKSRVDKEEKSLPYTKNGYEYWWYFEADSDYRTHVRKEIGSDEIQIILNETELSKSYDYFVLGDWEISPDNTLLAYTIDTSGDERYQLKILDLETMQHKNDILNDVEGSIVFGGNSREIIYLLLEPNRWHAKELKVHLIGEDQVSKIKYMI